MACPTLRHLAVNRLSQTDIKLSVKLRYFIIAGTVACGVSLQSVSLHGQTVGQFGGKPTRLPNVDQVIRSKVGAEDFVRSQPSDNNWALTKPNINQAWLQSTTPMASSEKAIAKLEQAKIEYHAKAWLSAEQSAWESISLFSQAIDLRSPSHRRQVDAGHRFRVAKDAIIEARDFGSSHGTFDSESLRRLAKSHRTNLIASDRAVALTAATAVDRYLDLARRNLAGLAARDTRCAEAIDFLAAIYLSRNDASQLPGETALCLRRAALQGQPNNADLAARLGMQLADVGLVDEAKWALDHSLQIDFQPLVANRLAMLLEATGEQAAADQLYAQVATRTRFREGVADDPSRTDLANVNQFSTESSSPNMNLPKITQLSPSQFAAISKPVMQKVQQPSVVSKTRSKTVIPASFASTRLDDLNQSLHAKPAPVSLPAEPQAKATTPINRWFRAIKSPWKKLSND
jgi:hypothetical protein